MMKLSPLKYGAAVVIPPFPSGNVWLALDQNLADIYIGDYNGGSWTLVSTGLPTNELAGSMIVRVADMLYFKKSNTIYYDDVNDLTTWATQTTTASAGSGLYSDGTYIYGVTGYQPFVRMTLPSSAITKPLLTGDSEAEDITSMGGVLYALTANSTSLYKSNDSGLNWTTTGSHGTSISAGTGSIDNDGTLLVFAYVSGTDGYVHTKSSSDNGATWSADQLTLGTAFSAQLIAINGMRHHEGKWFAITGKGNCAYSSNGTSWTIGATVPRDVKNVTYGIGKIVVGCNFSEMYETTNHGASWTLLAAPIPTGASIDNMTVHWIGDPP